MGWIARLFRAFGGKNKAEQDAPLDHRDTVKGDASELRKEKSLGAEVHEWLDETQSLKNELESESRDEDEDEHTRTVPTLKESDLPDLDKLKDD